MAALADTVAATKAQVERAKADLLTVFSHVPDEKLTWSPGGAARSSIQIVSHCGAAGHAFAMMLRGEAFPVADDPAEAAAMIRNAGSDVTSRAEAVRMVEDSTREILLALDGVTEERMGGMSQTPFGPMPYAIWLDIAHGHLSGHARQLDYIQTIWDDLEDHR